MAELLSPYEQGRLRVRNRVFFLSTGSNLGRNDHLSDRQVAFYRERARGGVGAVITEGLCVHPTSVNSRNVPLLYDRALLPQFEKLAAAVKGEGAAIFGQLWHVGRQALRNPIGTPWGPSGERDPHSGGTPHAMTEDEILEVIAAFAQAAVNLRDAGFDGAEVHGAHGYLVTQFMSPWSNRRTDRWGGSAQNRARFAIEIFTAIRKACGDDFPVGIKISADELVEGGLTLDDSREIMRHLIAQSPPDYMAVSQSNYSPSLQYHLPDMRHPHLPFGHLAKGIRDVAEGVPVMALAKVPDVAFGQRLIDDGVADLVGMSRPLIADAHHVRKIEAGVEPRPCVHCNVCWELVSTHRTITCMYGPETGRELEAEVAPVAADARRVVRVVGAGPAGLEFSRIAATAGHEVTLYEQQASPGGRFRWEATVPGREALDQAADWLVGAVRAAGATIRCGEPVDAGTVASWGSDDLVVLATGSQPIVEPLEGAAQVVSLEEAVADPAALVGPVFVIDELETEPVYATVESLARGGLDVTLMTRRQHIGRQVPLVSLIGTHQRLDELGVAILTLLQPERVDDGQLVARHLYSGRERHVGPLGCVVWAGPRRVTELIDTGGRETIVIGDASSPRAAVDVIAEAHAAARSLAV